MEKNIRLIKISIITSLVMTSTFLSVLPTTSAGIIFDVQSILNVTWENQTNEPIVPRGELRTLTLVITHSIARGALGEEVLVTLTGALVKIDVSVVDKSSWCTATISQGTLSVTVQPGEVSTVETQLTIQAAENAPAYDLGYVRVKAVAEKTGIIDGFENEFTLTFIPAYKALISPSLPETNVKEIGPMDTAVFPIDITNLGNARTIVLLNITSIPKNWVALVNSQLLLEEESGSGSTAIAYLIVKPPRSFGYHNDEQTIRISMQPVKADDYSKKGEITYETFLVQSRGFSTPGFEIFVFIVAFIIVMLISLVTRKRRRG